MSVDPNDGGDVDFIRDWLDASVTVSRGFGLVVVLVAYLAGLLT